MLYRKNERIVILMIILPYIRLSCRRNKLAGIESHAVRQSLGAERHLWLRAARK